MKLLKWTNQDKSISYRLFETNKQAQKWIKALSRVGLHARIVDINDEVDRIEFCIRQMLLSIETCKGWIKEYTLDLQSLLQSNNDYCSNEYAKLIKKLNERHNKVKNLELRINDCNNKLLQINPEYSFLKFSID